MRSLVPKLLTVAIVLVAALVWVPVASAVPTVSGTFELKSELGTNNKIAQGPDGNIWVTLPGKKVAKISPAGLIQEFELKIENTIGIAAGPEGRIWVVSTGKAASFLPADPTGTEQLFESALINAEPNIVLGPDGLFWVASNEAVAKFSPANFNGTIAKVTVNGTLSPKDIDVAGSLIAIADGGQEAARIVTFTTGTVPVQKDFTINGGSQGVAGAPTGQIGFSEQVPNGGAAEEVGVITPPNPALSVKQPDDPFGAAFGTDGAFWIVRAGGAHGLARLTATGELSLLGGFPAGLTPRQITAGPGHTLWVTDEENMKNGVIVRISGVELPPPPPPPVNPIVVTEKPVPNTKFGKGPKKVVKTTAAKATVKFTFSSTVAGSTFQCRLVKVPTGKKKKAKASKGAFAACRSPKVLKLAPGKYRFAVRAVAAGAIDGSPAEKAFKVVRAPRHR
jgi:sugar lactone lactonase YvrE